MPCVWLTVVNDFIIIFCVFAFSELIEFALTMKSEFFEFLFEKKMAYLEVIGHHEFDFFSLNFLEQNAKVEKFKISNLINR